MTGPATPHNGTGPNARGLARFCKRSDDAFHGYVARTAKLFELGAPIGGRILCRQTPWHRKLRALRRSPSFSRPHVDDDCHSLLAHLSNSVTRNSELAMGEVACVQKGFARTK